VGSEGWRSVNETPGTFGTHGTMNPRNPPSWRRNQIAVVAATFVGFTGFTLVMPFLSRYIQELGVTDTGEVALWAGATLGITPGIAALCAPLWGRVADRFGNKLLVQRSLLSCVIVMALMAKATEPWHLFALRAAQGLLAGYGSLTLDARPTVTTPYAASVTAFNGANGTLLFYVSPQLGAPFVITGTFSGTTLTIPIPAIKSVVGAPDAAITQVSLGIGGIGNNYFANPGTACARSRAKIRSPSMKTQPETDAAAPLTASRNAMDSGSGFVIL